MNYRVLRAWTRLDTYQGSLFEPVSLHKYLYANADPVTYCDPTGYMADVKSLSAGMVAFSIMDAAEAAYDAVCIAVRMTIIHKLREIEVKTCSKVTELVFDLVHGIEISRGLSVTEWLEKLKAKILGKSICDVIASVGDRRDGDTVYYHATTLATALLILASKTILESEMEGYHVFAWKLIPNKKALAKSGAQSSEVIVAFPHFLHSSQVGV